MMQARRMKNQRRCERKRYLRALAKRQAWGLMTAKRSTSPNRNRMKIDI
jgi:hypothetical protein